MYSYLKGKILFIDESRISLLIDNTGLGLEILVSPIIMSKVNEGDNKEFFIYHHITEVSQTLFGFENLTEKRVFKNLIKIDGIGGKVAINILGLGINNLAKAIEESDDKLLTTIPGIGKKTALKIILDMKDKVEASDLFNGKDTKIKSSSPGNKEIIETLASMGYDKKKVEDILKNTPPEIVDIKDKAVYVIKMIGK